MNLILFSQQDIVQLNHIRLTDRRFKHIQTVLRSKVGDQLVVGEINGKIGQGKIVNCSSEAVDLEFQLTQDPPQAIPLTLIMPMVRPPMFKRMLFHATSLGIKRIYVLNFARVEKSFWTSSSLRPEEIQEQLILGLEQAKDTILPHVEIHVRFKPFVEDVLPVLSKDTLRLVAHPGGAAVIAPITKDRHTTLIIGPEGGLVDFELELLNQLNFVQFDLGKRILRVETALPVLIGRLFR